MNKHMRTISFMLLITALYIFSGCGSQKQTPNKYYVIERSDDIEIPNYKSKSVIMGYCKIEPVDIYPAYASKAIANRSNSHEIIYYKSHQWAVRPGESLTMLLKDYLTDASVFKGISTRFWEINPAYRLATTVYKLEILQEDQNLAAHLSLKFALYDNQTNDLLASYKADRKETLQNKNLNFFAATIANIFYEELQRFTQKMMHQTPEQQKPINP